MNRVHKALTLAVVAIGWVSCFAAGRAVSAVSPGELKHCAAGQCQQCQFQAVNCKEVACAWSANQLGSNKTWAIYTDGSNQTQQPICQGMNTGYSTCQASGEAFCTQRIFYENCTSCPQGGKCDCSMCDPGTPETASTITDTCGVCKSCP